MELTELESMLRLAIISVYFSENGQIWAHTHVRTVQTPSVPILKVNYCAVNFIGTMEASPYCKASEKQQKRQELCVFEVPFTWLHLSNSGSFRQTTQQV